MLVARVITHVVIIEAVITAVKDALVLKNRIVDSSANDRTCGTR